MTDYPDLDEEYELTYADEFELLRETEEDADSVRKKSNPARRTLDFTSPVVQRRNSNNLVNDDVLSYQTNSLQCLQTENLTEPSILSPVLNENVSNKRTIEDLFGDINDIDFNTLELPSKKQKTEEERDLELIERIIEGRRLKRILDAPKNQSYANPESLYNFKDNISVNIPRWAFLPITNSEGERVYVKLESEDVWDRSLGQKSDHLSLFSSYTSTWEEARRILETKRQEMISESQQPLPDMEEEINEASLWVDKYKPLSYIDLLSEEPVNRALLHWLHLWDQVVFKKEVKVTDAQQRNSFSKRAGQFQLTNKWKSKKDPEPEMDKDGRPHHKVALLCGPPGVGKTTLAHLLARLAGYRPLELNASNERSTEEFRKALQGATQMRSVLGYDRRPNCLILDEIDGAPIQTVELLVKWCTATSESGSKKAKTHPLKRPVIAICNNLYATSLRPLRPVSLVISVGGVSETRLGERLSRVAAHEGLTLAPHVAAALATRAQGDVRAAIQVLSFIKARAKTQVSMEDVNNAAVGTKDCTKNLMQALNAIFTLDNKQHNDVVRTIQTAGEYDRIAEGIFDHYVSRIGSTSRLDAANCALSWLRLYDVTYAWILRHQNYAIYGSLPHYLSRCRAYLASRTPARIGFPMQALEMRRRRTEIESIEAGIRAGCGASVCGTTRRALLLDVLPLLPYLLAPSLRSANVLLLSDKEREVLRTCASAMCDYGLQYTQQRTPDGLYEFLLEPDIYKIAFFGNEDRVRPLPSIRQTISREQQLEVIRRNQLTTGKVNTEKPKEQSKPEKNKPLPNHLQRLTPMEVVKKAPQVQKDFFGRIVPIVQTQTAVASTDVISSSKVFYQYREGFNNAVRRNVRMRDLL